MYYLQHVIILGVALLYTGYRWNNASYKIHILTCKTLTNKQPSHTTSIWSLVDACLHRIVLSCIVSNHPQVDHLSCLLPLSGTLYLIPSAARTLWTRIIFNNLSLPPIDWQLISSKPYGIPIYLFSNSIVLSSSCVSDTVNRQWNRL